jgi:hypothetical protein
MVDHDTRLTGPAFAGSLIGPAILRRTDREFIPAILNGLRTSDGRAALAQTKASTRDENNVLKLFQPVHQIQHVAVVQAFCDTFGWPRLDANKIDSCGMVVRRISKTSASVMERWSKSGDQVVGWAPCADDDLDPDPARRRPRVTSGNAEIDARLVLPVSAYNGYTESTSLLFPAPPDVCTSAKATILYGLIPVTSTEKSEIAPKPTFNASVIAEHLPWFLLVGKSRSMSRAGETLSGSNAADSSLTATVNALRQLTIEFDLFGSSAEAATFFGVVNQLSVYDKNGNRLSGLGDFLKSASDVLAGQKAGTITMPAQWPDVDAVAGAAIATSAQKALEARVASLVTGEGRYEDASRQYRLRAFARVKRTDGCPPALIWTDYSEPFTIAPWYDSSGLPPVKIQLPSIDGNFLRNMKPNVAFAMPEDLFNLLQKDPTKSVQGQDSAGGGMGLGLMWLCSFNIPIITICAFIVLNIFLGLFNIFFQWMLFIKICIPIPVPTPAKKN